jgi:hypothetical protein
MFNNATDLSLRLLQVEFADLQCSQALLTNFYSTERKYKSGQLKHDQEILHCQFVTNLFDWRFNPL